jgi:hypothetical protein
MIPPSVWSAHFGYAFYSQIYPILYHFLIRNPFFSGQSRNAKRMLTPMSLQVQPLFPSLRSCTPKCAQGTAPSGRGETRCDNAEISKMAGRQRRPTGISTLRIKYTTQNVLIGPVIGIPEPASGEVDFVRYIL